MQAFTGRWNMLVHLACITAIAWPIAVAKPQYTAASIRVNVWLTTPDQSKLLQQQAPVFFTQDTGTTPLTIGVDETRVYQQMDGFGGSLTDSAAWLLYNKLDFATRTTVMMRLFDPVSGIGLSFLRQPMGASDYALSNYTYDDMPANQTDPNLANFTIAHDMQYIIPLLKQALGINPRLKIMATPWSPPGWMKTTDAINGGALLPGAYGPYAAYFAKFVQAYAAQGLPIYAVSPQNEPSFLPSVYNSPGMTMTAAETANFVRNYLGPTFAAAHIDTKILVFDDPWYYLYTPYLATVMSDPTTRSYIAGTSYHCYAGDPTLQTVAHDAYPDKDIYFTECSRGLLTPTSFADSLAYDMHNLIIGATRNWAKTVVKWNIALDQNNGPQNGGCWACYSLATVDTTTGAVTYNVDYYTLGHISKFVTPGAYRIGSNTFGSGSIEDVAFMNPDGSKALIVYNGASARRSFRVRWGTQSFTYQLPAGSAATFTWAGRPSLTSFSAYSQMRAEFATAMYGPRTETSQDAGGGLDVGNTYPSSYLVFKNVDFGTGAGSVQLRMASAQTRTGGTLELHLENPRGPLIGSVSVPNTGGWQSWMTKSAPVSGVAGIHDVYVVFKGPVYGIANLNWLTFDRSAFAPLKAAVNDSMYGASLEQSQDDDGGQDVNATSNQDYIGWQNVDFSRGTSSARIRVASAATGGTLDLHVDGTDGPLIGSLKVPNTHGWQAWTTRTIPVSGTLGVHDLYVTFKSSSYGIASLNWVQFR